MDIQTLLDNAVKSARQTELSSSPQLLLGEIILKLEAVKNKELPLFIDLMDKRPMGIGSWRGSYCELAIRTEIFGSYNTDGDSYEMKEIGCQNPTVEQWIDVLKEAEGKTFVGYKGGDFFMSKNTPVWLAEYGNSSFKTDDNSNYSYVYFIDIREDTDKVYLITKIEKEE